jgi:hypothetical protein
MPGTDRGLSSQAPSSPGEGGGRGREKRDGVMRAYRFTYRRMSTPRMIPSEMKLIIVKEPP